MLRYIALRRFNYIDAVSFGATTQLVLADQYLYAAAAIIVGSIVSVVCEKTARTA